MKTKKILLNACGTLALCLLSMTVNAQVGIGTLEPDSTAMLDVQSTSKGLLAPRMTTLERNAIVTPANSLLVFDTDEKAFHFYNTATTSWVKLANDASVNRDNYKLIKSVADLSDELVAGGGSTYQLTSDTFYEINGTITLAASIDLNNAYIAGIDANEDVLSYTGGTVFKGSTGGSIRNLTLKGSKAFEITGPGIATTASLLVQNTIIDGMTNVGSVDGLGMFFGNIVQFLNNANGITYSNIGNLLLNNQGWFGNNSGTFETFTGTFGLIEKVSGFSTVSGSAVAIDVSTSGLTVGTGVLQSTVFTGTTSAPSGYVKGYATGSYPGFKFNNSWTVNCPGIKLESDNVAAANIYFDGTLTTGFGQTVNNNSAFNLSGNSNSNTTTAVNLLRTSSPQDNRITYEGKKTRTFQVNAALSIRGNSGVGTYYAFFIRKNGNTTLVETNTLMRVNNTSDVSSNSISGTVELAPGDYIEIWGQRLTSSGTDSISVFSLNLSIK
ncbi:hypothetical protein [Xanthomarina sp. F2636L]|uniref:hypothetical protein n=1 Tax=Xanthomarina sp. F2636L TaxID=2996018 RepID=UPI00225E3452|nr:hypothetical protein [Xanthomarina sp. F2636L]MCX7550968.1 hypothetical protein [Xanthomarina sp. F2636L]